MFERRKFKTSQFYPDSGRPLTLNASGLDTLQVASSANDIEGIAISVALNQQGDVVTLPFQHSHTKASITPLGSFETSTSPRLLLDHMLSMSVGKPLLIDVAGTSPRLIHEIKRLVKRHDCLDRLCCGSRFDGVAERLLTALPEALHFMPRAARARVTLGLLLNHAVPNVAAYSVINLPPTFEGLSVVSEQLVEQLSRLGLHLNVVATPSHIERKRLMPLGVSGIIINALESHLLSAPNQSEYQRHPA